MESVITSRQNKIVKFIRSLRDKRSREKEGLIAVEGIKFLKEALLSGINPETVVVSEKMDIYQLAGEMISRNGVDALTVRVSEEVMDYICETDTPQGVLALFRMPQPRLEDLSIRKSSLVVIVDGVQDPGNVGTIVRTADAFGADAVVLTRGSADLYNSKTLRSTMGSFFHIPVINGADLREVSQFLRESGLFTAVTSLVEEAVSLESAVIEWPLALVLGSEARGVSDELSSLADIVFKIPMAGSAESLNVAVAAGILLYEAARRRGSNSK